MHLPMGLLFMNEPKDSAVRPTLIIAIFLMASGLFRIVCALSGRFRGWQSVLLNGVVTLALGAMIYRQWPVSGLWAIGLFIGVEMLFSGWAWIMLSLVVRRGTPAAA